MSPFPKLIAASLMMGCLLGCNMRSSAEQPKWAIVIHGGAGVIERASMSRQTEAAYRAALSAALETGSKALREGRSALDAVESAIRLLEDAPLFNAGRGAVFTSAGRNELDASIMDGATLKAGVVASVTRTRHPISLARAVMEKSPHVMLAGEGADAFAEQQRLELVDPSFFFTERRWQELEKALKERGEPIPARPEGAPKPRSALSAGPGAGPIESHEFGTVGVVALDMHGNLAAG